MKGRGRWQQRRLLVISQGPDSAILEDEAWSTWLGEDGATPVVAKAGLKTVEGVNWKAALEPKKPRPRRT